MAEEPTFDLDVDGSFPDDGLAISVEIPNDEESFNEQMMTAIKESVIDPLTGIDVAADQTTLVSLARNGDGSYTARLHVGSDDS
jgi:hypothetical protein